ncbi:MAG: hypothetical protein ACJ78M_11245 [Gemmatimonadaceae bacterium]
MRPIHSNYPVHERAPRPYKGGRRAMMMATSAMLSLAALGCGSDGLLGPGLGSGTLTATGAVTASGSGLAVFQSVSSGGTSLFQILVAPVSQSAAVWQLQIANYTGRLAVGTYNLSPLSASSSDPTANFYYTAAAAVQTFNSTSGQLVITSSSPSEVRGTFTFTATEASGGTGTVSVQGSFTAQCAPGTSCQ